MINCAHFTDREIKAQADARIIKRFLEFCQYQWGGIALYRRGDVVSDAELDELLDRHLLEGVR